CWRVDLSEEAKLVYVQERLDKVKRRIKYAWLFSLLGAGLVIFSYVFEPFLSNARALEIIGVLIVCIGVIVNLVYGTPQKNKLMKQLETKTSLNSCKKCGKPLPKAKSLTCPSCGEKI
ncbi:hypothetical protein KAX01_01850, partial [Candidatus Bathyarchaeota archaeon]|nr:hypothetical protein [Candidatus Bathyarchaeota archaeon]